MKYYTYSDLLHAADQRLPAATNAKPSPMQTPHRQDRHRKKISLQDDDGKRQHRPQTSATTFPFINTSDPASSPLSSSVAPTPSSIAPTVNSPLPSPPSLTHRASFLPITHNTPSATILAAATLPTQPFVRVPSYVHKQQQLQAVVDANNYNIANDNATLINTISNSN